VKQVITPTWTEMELLTPREIEQRIGSGVPGQIYLLHFVEFDNETGLWKSARIAQHAGHYIGWSYNVERRLKDHESGRGARITAAAKENGFSWIVTDVIPGDKYLERYMKNSKNAKQFCRCCVGVAAEERLGRLRDKYASRVADNSIKEI
jgi:predicted GIY-YIG superfamily endonuclease